MIHPVAHPRVLLIADFTIAGLASYLEAGEPPLCHSVVAPFGQVSQVPAARAASAA